MGLTLTRRQGLSIIIDNKKLTVIDIKQSHVLLEFERERFALKFFEDAALFGSVSIKACPGVRDYQVKITVDAPRWIDVDREEIHKQKRGF